MKGWQPHFQLAVAKSSTSTIVHWFALVTCHTWEHNQYPVAQIFDRINRCIARNKFWSRQLRDQTLCFTAWDCFFSSAATKGWAWCKHSAELVEGAAALRNLKLLVESGCLEFQKGIAGMDSRNKHVVTCCEHLQPKGSQPRFQPTEAKSLVCRSHRGAQSV